MNRRNFPTGQASTAMLKSMFRALAAEKGPSAAESWLRAIRMVRTDLEDETRLVPLPSLHRALVAFAELGSRNLIPRLWTYLVAPDSLGVWVRVLRGTSAPSEAFGRLDTGDSEYGRTTRWETTATRRGWWQGLVRIAHDPALEQDGLLGLARLAELAAVPALFGWRDPVARTLASKEAAAGLMQEFEVQWSVPDVVTSGTITSVVGGAVGAVPLFAHVGTGVVGALSTMAGALAGALGGTMLARERLAGATSHAQATRVQALERSLYLKESREREMGGQLEGTVAAGQYRILRRMGSGATGTPSEMRTAS